MPDRPSNLPADFRLQLYQEAMQLRTARGWGYRRIAKALSAAHAIDVPKGTVSNWLLGRHNPAGRLHRYFEAIPSPELSYVIGAVLGDGYTAEDRGNGIVAFTNKDRGLLLYYLACLSSVLGAPSVGRIAMGRYGVSKAIINCRLLVILLRKPLPKLAPFIERYPAPFIRGFFDAEGSSIITVNRGNLTAGVSASNTDVRLLRYISRLLRDRFHIHSSIRVARKPWRTVIHGKPVQFKKIVFALRVRRIRDVQVFASKIGFASARKQKILGDALGLIRAHGSREAAGYWPHAHQKIGNRWQPIPHELNRH
ncbi:MAG: LAGLIDADG family homing endonuclease [Candidatus Bathyarchaeia archaeon]